MRLKVLERNEGGKQSVADSPVFFKKYYLPVVPHEYEYGD